MGNGSVILLIEPEVLEQEAETIRMLTLELEYLEGQEVMCEIIAPNGEILEISNWDYQHYKRGTIRKFIREHKDD